MARGQLSTKRRLDPRKDSLPKILMEEQLKVGTIYYDKSCFCREMLIAYDAIFLDVASLGANCIEK
jgi:hypothetical protein